MLINEEYGSWEVNEVVFIRIFTMAFHVYFRLGKSKSALQGQVMEPAGLVARKRRETTMKIQILPFHDPGISFKSVI